MRPLELLVIACVLLAAALGIFYFQKPCPRWLIRLVLTAAIAATGSQVLWEDWRWQMLPVYVSLIALIPLFSVQGPAARILLIASLLLGGVVSAAAGYIFPVFTLPMPRGPYHVGTFVRHLIDRGRHERHAASPTAPRELMIQVWYPAKHVPGVRAWYRDPRMNTLKSAHFRLVKTHSYWNLPVADEPAMFPVLLFSPSSGGFRSQNTFEVEELVSQGYIVVAIDHPYSSSRVVFPDRRMAHSLPWIDTSSQEAYEESNRKVELMVQDHVADARFVLDEMERWNLPASAEVLLGRMDLTKVGVFGHSFGGSLAASLCVDDPRVVAGINMDGWLFGDALKAGIAKPFFVMVSGDGSVPNRLAVEKLSGDARIEAERDLTDWQATESSLQRFGGYHLAIIGYNHGNYSDLALFRRPVPFLGPRRFDPYRAFEIVDGYTLAFFDRYIRNRPAPLLDQPRVSQEVRFEVHPAPAPTSQTAVKN